MARTLKNLLHKKAANSLVLKNLFIDYHDRLVLNNERRRVSRAYFNSIRNIHQGRRGFVIGNGPSLKPSDLSKIRNEVSIASNLIYLIFDQTDWRPNYVTVVDRLVWDKLHSIASRHYRSLIIAGGLDPAKTDCLTYTMFSNGHAPSYSYSASSNSFDWPFSADLSKGVWGGSTVTYENLQLAVHLGLNPIYLIGCDHYYQGESSAVEGVPVTHSVKNHFSDAYRSVGEKVNPAPIGNMTRAYEIAQSFALSRGIEIVNATRGGYLEVFPRCDFDNIFSR